MFPEPFLYILYSFLIGYLPAWAIPTLLLLSNKKQEKMKIFEVFPLVQLGCLIVVAFVLRIHTIYNLKTHLYLIQCDVSQSNALILLTAANNP